MIFRHCIFFIILTSNTLSAVWPLKGVEPINTYSEVWRGAFFSIKNSTELHLTVANETQVHSNFMYNYEARPDIIKHFPLEENSNLVVAILKKKRKLVFVAFRADGEKFFEEEYDLAFYVIDADVRVNEEGRPVCLFYHIKNNNHVITLWQNGATKDILYNDDPIYQIDLNWENKIINVLNRFRAKLYWTISRNENIKKFELPFMRRMAFHYNQNKKFLFGADLEGNLWRVRVINGKVRRQKIITKKEFRYIDRILISSLGQRLILLMPSSRTNSIWWLTFEDINGNIVRGKPKRKRLFTSKKIHPIILNNKLNLLIETELKHLYLEPWKNKNPHINQIKWKVSTDSGSSKLIIQWMTKPKKYYKYSYLLDHRPDSSPLNEYSFNKKNKITKVNLNDGFYGFHLRIKKGKYTSPLYHIPIEWRYNPDQPDISIKNEIAPNLVAPGSLRFFIMNPAPVHYYAAINSKPNFKPKKKITLKKGMATVGKNLRPGRYYLHIRARDQRSGLFGSTLHYLFFVDPYNPEQDSSLRENNKTMSELKFILRKIQESKEDAKELKKWVKKLKELQTRIAN